MSLLLFDSAKKFGSSSLNDSQIVAAANGIILSANNSSVHPTNGRDGGPTFQGAGTNSGVLYALSRTFSATEVIIFGLHIRPGSSSGVFSLGTSGLSGPFSTTGTLARLTRDTSTGVLTWNSGTSTPRVSSILTLNAGEDYFVEGKILLATNATGSVHIKVDGVDFIGGTSGVDGSDLITVGSATPVSRVGIGTTGNGRCDVFYICDTEGDYHNDFLGNVTTIKPAINSDHSVQFTPSEGEHNYAMVDENPSDEDDTYNSSATPGHKDLFGHSNGLSSDSIFGVQVAVRSRKEESGTLGVKLVVSSNGTEAKTPLRVPTTSYAYDYMVLGLDPATDQPFDANAANALKVGYEATLDA